MAGPEGSCLDVISKATSVAVNLHGTTFSSSNGSSSIITPPSFDNQSKVVRKRMRAVISCGPCRTGKLKCDRLSPCANCTRRNRIDMCAYSSSDGQSDKSRVTRPSRSSDVVQSRIDKLERLVLSLMESGHGKSPTSVDDTSPGRPSISTSRTASTQRISSADIEITEADTDEVTKTLGHLQFDDNRPSYTGDSHWATILHELSEVKSCLNEHESQYRGAFNDHGPTSTKPEIHRPAFLLSGRSLIDAKELMHRLPSKGVVDELVNRYFSDYDPGVYILHMPSWRRRYERYWTSRSVAENTDPAFLAQIFAICGLAMQSYYKAQDEPYEYLNRSQDLSAMYRGLTQQALQVIDYSKIEQTTIEVYILHLYAEFQQTGEADIGIYILIRMTISLAMRIGMHRDGTNFGISPFQCEMRRRQWSFLRMADTNWSFIAGLPIMIKGRESDTQLPANLEDEDFDEDTQTMPPSRPRTCLTNMSYLIAKTRIASIFAIVIETVTGIGTILYDDIVKLDGEVEQAYRETAPALQLMLPIDPAEDVSDMIFAMRLSLSILYHKTVCVLHRRYLTASRQHKKLGQSRRACIDAALNLLQLQQIVNKEFHAAGRLFRLQAHIAAYMTHDFILAATLVGLDLLASTKHRASQAIGESGENDDLELWARDRSAEQRKALEDACLVWDGMRAKHTEASKAYVICGMILRDINKISSQPSNSIQQGQKENTEESVAQAYSMPDSLPSVDACSQEAGIGVLVGSNESPHIEPGMTVVDSFAMSSDCLTKTAMTSVEPLDMAQTFSADSFQDASWNTWAQYISHTGFDKILNNNDAWPGL